MTTTGGPTGFVIDDDDFVRAAIQGMRNHKDVEQAITYEAANYNQHPEPPATSARLELAKAKE
jgi:hypothetical protein